MGDNRATVRIHFAIYGKVFDCDMSINYDGFDQEVDERVLEFFRDAWREAHGDYVEECERIDRERRRDERLAIERKEYERLKAKFGDSSPTVMLDEQESGLTAAEAEQVLRERWGEVEAVDKNGGTWFWSNKKLPRNFLPQTGEPYRIREVSNV